MPLFRLIISFCWIYYLVFWLAAARRVKTNAEKEPLGSFFHYSSYILVGAILLSYDVAPWGFNRRMFADSPAAAVTAAALTVGGLVLAVWARCVLGKNWSGTVTIKKDHELVQRGPYRWVRNPIYSGVLLMILGAFANVGRIRGLVGTGLICLGFWIKIRREEAFMRRRFPVEFPEYERRVKSLIPYVL